MGRITNSSNKFPNIVINGGMNFWQRTTSISAGSFTSGTNWVADRWTAFASTASGTFTTTASQVTDSPANVLTKFAFNMAASAVSSAVLQHWNVYQKVEMTVGRPLFSKKCTLSFWYKSNRTGQHIAILSPTSGTAQRKTFTVDTADTWEYKVVAMDTSLFNAAGTETGNFFEIALGLRDNVNGQTSVSNGDYFRFTQVMLNEGQTASPFQMAGGNLAGELALCQRYYEKSYNIDINPGTASNLQGVSTGMADSTNGRLPSVSIYKSTKRATPVYHAYSSLGTIDKVTVIGGSDAGGTLDYTDGTFGTRSGGFILGTFSNNTGYYWHWTADAEL